MCGLAAGHYPDAVAGCLCVLLSEIPDGEITEAFFGMLYVAVMLVLYLSDRGCWRMAFQLVWLIFFSCLGL